MLNHLDLTQTISKEEYRLRAPQLKKQIGKLQWSVFESRFPVLILFEGMQFAGKRDSIRHLIDGLDPRGFKVHLTEAEASEEEALRPFPWRFWMRIPARGEIGVFDHGWCLPVLTGRLNGEIGDETWEIRKREIREFERHMTDGGAALIKFWLHIGKKDLKRRLKKIERSPYESWRVTENDWNIHQRYKRYIGMADELLRATQTDSAPWRVIASTDKRFRRVQVLEAIRDELERFLDGRNAVTVSIPAPAAPEETTDPGDAPLSRSDPTKSLDREQYERILPREQKRLRELEYVCYERRLPVIIVYEGWDAAGKGGNIKRVTKRLDPRGYSVIPICAPKGSEATHHYLWRFWRHIPKAGHIAIFDRSWYGRVLVERIEGFCLEEEWRRAYGEINEFERSLADAGAVIVKFWLHISKEEQLRRFKSRQRTPRKRHKLTEEDWRNRDKWDLYEAAVNEMLARTDTDYAPWTIVEGDCKYWARVKAIRAIVEAIESNLFPDHSKTKSEREAIHVSK